MQLVAYSLGATTLGYEPNELTYRYEYLVKTAKPELITCPVRIDDDDRRRFLKTTVRVWKAIQSEIFFPNPSYCAVPAGISVSAKNGNTMGQSDCSSQQNMNIHAFACNS